MNPKIFLLLIVCLFTACSSDDDSKQDNQTETSKTYLVSRVIYSEDTEEGDDPWMETLSFSYDENGRLIMVFLKDDDRIGRVTISYLKDKAIMDFYEQDTRRLLEDSGTITYFLNTGYQVIVSGGIDHGLYKYDENGHCIGEKEVNDQEAELLKQNIGLFDAIWKEVDYLYEIKYNNEGNPISTEESCPSDPDGDYNGYFGFHPLIYSNRIPNNTNINWLNFIVDGQLWDGGGYLDDVIEDFPIGGLYGKGGANIPEYIYDVDDDEWRKLNFDFDGDQLKAITWSYSLKESRHNAKLAFEYE